MSVIALEADGWQGVPAREFTFANVAIITQAIAMYIKSQGQERQGVQIGYDNRFLGHLFAERVAEVLAGNGIPALLCDAPAPIPAVASAVLARGLSGGIVIIASHNEPEYNGIRFIPSTAGLMTPEMIAAISRYIAEVEADREAVQVTRLRYGLKEGGILYDSPRRGYLERLKRLVDGEAIRAGGLKVMIDTMHGSSIGYLETVLPELGVEVVEKLRDKQSASLGGYLPEPTAEQVQGLITALDKQHAHVGLALGVDGSRCGLVDSTGTYIKPSEVYALLVHYFITQRSNVNTIARTVATTHWVDRIAHEHGVRVVETPLGFTHIEEQLRLGVEIGGDETGSVAMAGPIREQDGLLVALLLLEMIAKTLRTPTQLLWELGEQYGASIHERLECRMSPEQSTQVLQRMQDWHSDQFGKWRIISKRTIDGVKWCFHTGAWMLVHATGAEQQVNVYVEANEEEELDALKEAIREVLGLAV